MLRIALCDDLQDQLEIMKTAVQTYYQNKASNIEIYAYNNAMNFVDAVEERKDFDSKKIIFRLVGGGIQVEVPAGVKLVHVPAQAHDHLGEAGIALGQADFLSFL